MQAGLVELVAGRVSKQNPHQKSAAVGCITVIPTGFLFLFEKKKGGKKPPENVMEELDVFGLMPASMMLGRCSDNLGCWRAVNAACQSSLSRTNKQAMLPPPPPLEATQRQASKA